MNKKAKIHSSEPTKQHHSIWDVKNELRITLQLCWMFLVFRRRQLTQEEIKEAGEYKDISISPNADSWNPNYEY